MAAVHGAAQQFSFEDPKGVNHVVFMLDAPLEFISGTGRGVSGIVTFDPEAPEATAGTITLLGSSLTVPNPTMTEHMHGGDWLDLEANPNVVFNVASFSVESREADSFSGIVHGSLTLMGKTNAIAVPATITYVKDGVAQRQRGDGDLIVVRSNFKIKLSDYGLSINPVARLKVSDEVELRVVMAGRTVE